MMTTIVTTSSPIKGCWYRAIAFALTSVPETADVVVSVADVADCNRASLAAHASDRADGRMAHAEEKLDAVLGGVAGPSPPLGLK